MKLTEWFPADVKPVRDGVYETEHISAMTGRSCGNGFTMFKNGDWMNQYENIDRASRDEVMGTQSKKWRGLAEPPK